MWISSLLGRRDGQWVVPHQVSMNETTSNSPAGAMARVVFQRAQALKRIHGGH